MKFNQMALALFSSSAVSLVWADDVAQNLDEVHVRTKRVVNEKGYKAERTDITGVNTSILDTPYSIDVVTQKQLQDKQPENLEEAVKGVSGLNSGNNLAGTIDTIVRRGYGTNRDGSIMRNGMGSALARNLTATTERVEVLKGPASVVRFARRGRNCQCRYQKAQSPNPSKQPERQLRQLRPSPNRFGYHRADWQHRFGVSLYR